MHAWDAMHDDEREMYKLGRAEHERKTSMLMIDLVELAVYRAIAAAMGRDVPPLDESGGEADPGDRIEASRVARDVDGFRKLGLTVQ